jgi:hypothetical protein
MDWMSDKGLESTHHCLRSWSNKRNGLFESTQMALKKPNKFRGAVSDEWRRRKISERTSVLSKLSHLPPPQLRCSILQLMWDKRDSEISYIFQYAESHLKAPALCTSWSPAIVKAGAIKRYWRTRISHIHRSLSYGTKPL